MQRSWDHWPGETTIWAWQLQYQRHVYSLKGAKNGTCACNGEKSERPHIYIIYLTVCGELRQKSFMNGWLHYRCLSSVSFSQSGTYVMPDDLAKWPSTAHVQAPILLQRCVCSQPHHSSWSKWPAKGNYNTYILLRYVEYRLIILTVFHDNKPFQRVQTLTPKWASFQM